MSITRAPFGALPDGRPVERITLEGRNGLSASILTYGATLQSLCFDGRDVVLGYDSLEDYRRCGGYQGATIGRYGNRIAGGRFALGGTTYDVGCNESGRGHLHGGETGFDKYIWDAEILSDDGEPSVRFSLVSADGDMGYPGRLTVSVTFTVRDENALELAYRAVSDKDTVLNLTNHAYFNLNGYDGGDILDNVLTIDADAITPVDGKLIPTGEFLAVEGTPFDFREGKPIGQDIEDPLPAAYVGRRIRSQLRLERVGLPPGAVRLCSENRHPDGLSDRPAGCAVLYGQRAEDKRGKGRRRPLPPSGLLPGNPTFSRQPEPSSISFHASESRRSLRKRH